MLNKDDNEGFDCGVVSDGMPSPVQISRHRRGYVTVAWDARGWMDGINRKE